MNIYMTSENPKLVGRDVPEGVWERRLYDAVELVSEGAAHWENEDSMFICHDMNHAWVDWVRKSRENWVWTIGYLRSLIKELGKRGHPVIDEVVSFSDFVSMEYGGKAKQITLPPRCLPREFKGKDHTIASAVESYRKYVEHRF